MTPIVDVCSQWQLSHPMLVVKQHTSHIYRAVASDNSVIVVKLSNDARTLMREAKALQTYDGNGSVRIFATDEERLALLLESIAPGTNLQSLVPIHDDRATIIAATVIKRLHQNFCAHYDLPTLAEWIGDLSHPIPDLPRERALAITKQLLLSAKSKILLHGDVHHENILKSEERGYVAIDPKGIIGDPDYDAAPFLCNPIKLLIESPDPLAIWRQRARLFSKLLHVSEDRLLAWSFVHAVAATCWAYEDGVDTSAWQTLAAIFDAALA